MKTLIKYITIVLVAITTQYNAGAQTFNLFTVDDLEEQTGKKYALVSLSDVHGELNEHSDSLSVPAVEYEIEKSNYENIELKNEYRKRFLSKVKLSEKDSLYVYDYSKNILKAFAVKNLKTIAFLNFYTDYLECPCNQYDYMLGFQLDKKELEGMSMYYKYAFAAFGKNNPFKVGKMKSIEWKQLDSTQYIGFKFSEKYKEEINSMQLLAKYVYETNDWIFFVFDFQYIDAKYPNKRLLSVYDLKVQKIVVEELFVNSEGSDLAPLNVPALYNGNEADQKQWVGPLLKNAPNCIFGFEWMSFGCSRMTLFNDKTGYKYNSAVINCDNRH